MAGITLSDWVQLLRLGRERSRSRSDYIRFQAFQSGLIVADLEKQGFSLAGRRVLDLGCGGGGYSAVMVGRGARVAATDRFLRKESCDVCRSDRIQWSVSDAKSLPFRDGRFDLVMCASLIEHVDRPEALLAEIGRVLALDGACYLSFPPFYSPVGGHTFKPYHLLGERVSMRIAGKPGGRYESAWGGWGLYRRTIRGVAGLIESSGFTIRRVSTRYSPVNVASLPVLGEFLTWHVEFIFSKRQGAG